MSQFFFLYCISQWNDLDSRIRNLPSIATFKPSILDFILRVPTPMFKSRLSGFVFLTRLRVRFSHLREHKFRHNILDVVDPICSCPTNAAENIGTNYSPLDSSSLSKMILFGNPKFFDNVNSGIIYAVIKFIESTSRCSRPIYD